MTYSVVKPDRFEWITRPHAEGEPARHVAELSEVAGFAEVRAYVALRARRTGTPPSPPVQEETFVVLSGTLSMCVGDPPRRGDVPTGGLITVRR